MNFLKRTENLKNDVINSYKLLQEESDRLLKETGCLVLQHKILSDAGLNEIEEISKITNLPYLYGYVIKENKNIALIGNPVSAVFDIKFGFNEEGHYFNEYIGKKDVLNKEFDIYVLDYKLLFDDRLKEYCFNKQEEIYKENDLEESKDMSRVKTKTRKLENN